MGMVPKSWCDRLCALLLAAFPVPAMRTTSMSPTASLYLRGNCWAFCPAFLSTMLASEPVGLLNCLVVAWLW